MLRHWGGGHRYEGQVNESGSPHGKGVVKYNYGKDSSRPLLYEGDFYHGTQHGRGIVLFNNGETMEGEWKYGQIYYGVYSWKTNFFYTGRFKRQTLHTPKGETSTRVYGGVVEYGSWKKGFLQGWVTAVYEDAYCRSFIVDGSRQGEITMFFRHGDVMTVNYVDNHRTGAASYLWANGDEWRGNFHADHHATGVKTEEATGNTIFLSLDFRLNEQRGSWQVQWSPEEEK